VPTFVDRGVSRGQHGGSHTTFLSSTSSFILTRAEWTPFQTHCYSQNLAAPGIEPRTYGTAARNSIIRPQRQFTVKLKTRKRKMWSWATKADPTLRRSGQLTVGCNISDSSGQDSLGTQRREHQLFEASTKQHLKTVTKLEDLVYHSDL
jgi:hypothetical protein